MPMRPRGNPKADLATISGVVIACTAVLGGLLMEGGQIRDILQVTAAFIVIGGTLGAVLVSTPLAVVVGAVRRFGNVVFDRGRSPNALIVEIIGYATKARKNGLVSLEFEAAKIEDPFLRKALNLAVDGADLQEIRKMMDLQIEIEEQHAMAEARVFECAGGYSPTIGIIGAVLGLIQVMKNLANIDEVGRGIAVAFVATVYGVGLANIFLLPAANKIKARIREDTERKELMLEGVVGIVEGLNPKLMRGKLDAYAGAEPEEKKDTDVRRPAGKPVLPEARAASARP
jgi:chemotaxis protein MotA